MVEIVADETDVLPRNRDEESFPRSFAGTWEGKLLPGPFSETWEESKKISNDQELKFDSSA